MGAVGVRVGAVMGSLGGFVNFLLEVVVGVGGVVGFFGRGFTGSSGGLNRGVFGIGAAVFWEVLVRNFLAKETVAVQIRVFEILQALSDL